MYTAKLTLLSHYLFHWARQGQRARLFRGLELRGQLVYIVLSRKRKQNTLCIEMPWILINLSHQADLRNQGWNDRIGSFRVRQIPGDSCIAHVDNKRLPGVNCEQCCNNCDRSGDDCCPDGLTC